MFNHPATDGNVCKMEVLTNKDACHPTCASCSPQTIQEAFEMQAQRTPDKVAVVFQGNFLTYQELNERASQLANTIRQSYHQQYHQPLQADTLIGLYVERSLDMIVSILAVLKAGCAYVPMSPEYPQSRLQFILEDTQTPLILSQKHLLQKVETVTQLLVESPVVLLADSEITDQASHYQPMTPTHGNDLSYVIYTSGTTGNPKGVMIEHHTVLNLIRSQTKAYQFDQEEIALWLPEYVFDASVEVLLMTLLNGAMLLIPTQSDIQSVDGVKTLISQFQVTHLVATSNYLSLLGELGSTEHVRRVITGGEACRAELKAFWKEKLINEYGPTEATVTSIASLDVYKFDTVNCIGKPIDNATVFLLNEQLEEVAPGEVGEIHIGGAGLARGYLNRPDLTKEKFIQNPFTTAEDVKKGQTRLYKTGDLARWMPDGNLEFFGRNDRQVKIRGFRIELAEIETALCTLPNIQQAAVIDIEHNGHQYLAAYVVATQTLDRSTIKIQLAEKLPAYMVPQSFTLIEAIPLTINGKLDRAALPEPENTNSSEYAVPTSALEEQLCRIWENVLGLPMVGIHDHFFQIGGDSIVCIQLVSKLRQNGFTLQVNTIYEAPTVAKLAEVILNDAEQVAIQAEQGILEGEFRLLPIQQAFFDNPMQQIHYWNQAFMLKVPGDVSVEQIEATLQTLTLQHDVLRSRFEKKEEGYCQYYLNAHDCTQPQLQQLDIRHASQQDIHDTLTDWQNHFHTFDGPLWQAGLLKGYDDGSARFFFAAHHLIIDSVSWRIIAEDVQQLLEGKTLENKTSSYRQWVDAVQKYGQSHLEEIPYWQAVTQGSRSMPDTASPTQQTVTLSNSLTQSLLHQANQGYYTEINDILLSALAIALQVTFQSNVNHITLEAHGREPIDSSLDISHTVGWFTTAYPVKLTASEHVEDTIIDTKEMLRTIPNKGIGYGTLHQQGKICGRLPIVIFNYLGQFDNQGDSAGLWSLITDNCGEMAAPENVEDYLFNIRGGITNGQLKLGVISQAEEGLTAIFAQSFEKALATVIQQCVTTANMGGFHTPHDFPVDLTKAHLKQLQNHYDIEAIFPANSLQQGFIYHHLNQPRDDAYLVQQRIDYTQALDIPRYQEAWARASERFPALRTAFEWDTLEMLQVITKGRSISDKNFEVIDLSALSEEAFEAEVTARLAADRQHQFDFRQPGFIRFILMKQNDQQWTVLKTEHHSTGDGWSGPLLLQSVHDDYDSLGTGSDKIVEAETAYIATQAYHASQQEKVQAYWQKEMQRFAKANDINLLLSQPINLSDSVVSDVITHEIRIDGHAYQDLKQACLLLGVTLNVALQFAWHKVLQTYTQDEQTIVGTIVSGRDIPVDGINESVGLYINTLPLAIDWKDPTSTQDMLQQIQQTISSLNSYSSVSLSNIQPGGERLFHTLFDYENQSEYRREGHNLHSQAHCHPTIEKVDYPLSILVSEQAKQDTLCITLSAGQGWMNDIQAARLLAQMNQVLQCVISTPEKPHTTIELLSHEEKHQILQSWNDTTYDFHDQGTTHRAFEAQAKSTPDAIALVFNNQTMTYEELNRRANQRASALQMDYQEIHGKPFQPESFVTLYLDRGFEMVVSILAVLKAGGAYVPVSPDYPDSRLEYMLKDTQPVCVITHQHYADRFQHHDSPRLYVEEEQAALPEPIDYGCEPNHLAYVIYTSGTTGQPKGVMVEHRSLMNLTQSHTRSFGFDAHETTLWVPEYVFDPSIELLFLTLLNGATLIIPSQEEMKSPETIHQLIQANEVTHLVGTANYLTLLGKLDEPHSIRRVITGGEPCSQTLKDNWKGKLINEYGPTETTVTPIRCMDISFYPESGRIGTPIDNVKAYVLSPTLSLQPVGAMGELYIGGAGLARGYLNRTELTEEKFIQNPFATADDLKKGHTRLYKTGDLVRWLVDGQLEFLGRNDAQVKIRGYRVELSEIEQTLTQFDEIKQALVIACDHHGQVHLAAYLVPNDHTIDLIKVQNTLNLELPSHMVPSAFVQIDEIPLTINGKVDTKALPAPDFINQQAYIAPTTQIQKRLTQVWQEILGIEKVGIEDNFFRIGGNSIMAIKLVSACRKALNIDLTLAQLFEYKTIAGLAKHLKFEVQTHIPVSSHPYPPLSFAQERLLFLEKFEQGSDAYHIPYLAELSDGIEIQHLETLFNQVIDSHPVLKTVYRQHQGLAYQHILNQQVHIQTHAVTDISILNETVAKHIKQPFDLENEPSIRLHHYQVEDKAYLLILWHHIGFDGWSVDLFFSDLSLAYQGKEIVNTQVQYADYAVWQKEMLSGEHQEEIRHYWQQQLADLTSLTLPQDYQRPNQQSYEGRDFNLTFNSELSNALRHLAAQQETTLYTVLLSAFYTTLSLVSGQDDIVIGTPSDNREHPDTQSMVGFFVNSLPLRAQVAHQQTVTEMIQQVHHVVTQGKLHQALPFEKLVQMLNIERDPSRHPVYQVMFDLESFGGQNDDITLPFEAKNLLVQNDLYTPAKFDLSLSVFDNQENLSANFNFATSLFKVETIARLANVYQRVLKAFVEKATTPIGEIDILSPEERHTLLHTWNETQADYPQDKTLQQRFEEQVEITPNHIAVIFEDQQMTYRDLNERANQLAHQIRETYQTQHGQSLQPDTLIALYFDRSIEMIVSIMAVLKAGAAYVPVSPEYPEARTGFILQDTQVPLLLTHSSHTAVLDNYLSEAAQATQLLLVDQISSRNIENPTPINTATDLAYVIYTSGTTGQPKGVMIEHRSIHNLIHHNLQAYAFQQDEVVALLTSYVFDTSIEQIGMTLLSGATLFVISESQRQSTDLLKDLIDTHQVTHLDATASLLLAVDLSQSDSIRRIVSGGEATPMKLYDVFKDKLINEYGPTETSVASHQFLCASLGKGIQTIPIGKTVSNLTSYILDTHGQPVPVGTPGELYIGGVGVARGYLNRPELTEERFIDNPFDQSESNQRLYKTGDRVRWLPDGNIEFLGRNDSQVKIRGYRIELGEIENTLNAFTSIKQAVVIDITRNNQKSLAAYIIPTQQGSIDVEHIRAALTEKLPEYMVPQSYTQIEQIPLTVNGKLNRAALPEPNFSNQQSYTAPRNAIETQLCEIWQNILGLEQVGIEDNFFQIGGDSIISIQLVNQLRQHGFMLQVKAIFEAPTIAKLAKYLEQQSESIRINAEQGILSGIFDLLPIQQWFFEENFNQPNHWNQAFMVTLPETITMTSIEKALTDLALHHDMLRVQFAQSVTGWQQVYRSDVQIPELKTQNVVELDSDEVQTLLTTWQQDFDLEHGPLWQAGVLTGFDDHMPRLFFAAHHLIIDAVSWRIIATDLQTLLQGHLLPEKTSSYRQWVNTVQQYSNTHQEEVTVWQNILADMPALPAFEQETAEYTLTFSPIFTQDLLQKANAGYHTQINDLLLSALSMAMHDTFGQTTQVITLEGHGREELDASIDVTRTLGWFTTTYPVKLNTFDSIEDTIIHTKETLRQIPNKGIGFGTFQQRGQLIDGLPPVTFNYLGQLDSTHEEATWQIEANYCGTLSDPRNQEAMLINFNGAVLDGQLQFKLLSRLNETNTKTFLQTFETALHDIVKHAIQQAAQGGLKSPADYQIPNLTLERLRSLEEKYDIEALYPANSLQQGFIYHALSHPQDDAYMVQMVMDYKTPLDLDAYQEAWRLASLQYPALRTAFDWDGDVLQVITKEASITASNFTLHDLRELDAGEREAYLHSTQEIERQQTFDLRKPGLMRFALLQQSEHHVTVIQSEHHSIMDGWSGPVLLQTVHRYYNQLIHQHTPTVDVDLAYFEAQDHGIAQAPQANAFWRQEKQQFTSANDINFMLSKKIDLNHTTTIAQPEAATFTIQPEITKGMKSLCQRLGVTMNVLLQFAWHKLIQTYTQDEQTIVGTTVSGRDLPVEDVSGSVGLYINTLPLAVHWSEDTSIESTLKAIQLSIANLNTYSNVALSELQTQGERLFHTLFVYENYPDVNPSQSSHDAIENHFNIRHAVEKGNYPLSLMAFEQESDSHSDLHLKLNFGADWLTSEDAAALLAQLEMLLNQVTESTERSHHSLSLVTPEMAQRITQWNQTQAPFASMQTLHGLFEEQAKKTPDDTALVFEGEPLSYQALNDRADRLARKIQAQYGDDMRADCLIALYLDRSLEMVISMLAVMKAGAAYLPISPEYPQARTRFILEDTQATMILTQPKHQKTLQSCLASNKNQPILLDVTRSFDGSDLPELQSISGPHDLAYVIYTSGTTGQPKGVMIEHRNAAFLMNAQHQNFYVSKCQSALSFAAYVFDASVSEIFVALTHGLTVYVCSEQERKDPQAVSALIEQHQVELATIPPALLTLLEPASLQSLKVLVSAGEAASDEILRQFSHENCQVINAYGPTEGTVCATTHDYQPGDISTNIGGPISNAQVYVLNKEHQQVPIGAQGELYIGGAGLARGYLNRPELTQERFIQHPLAREDDKARLYQTGDQVRWLPTGELEFLGRNDDQIKIRGYRVELGEIEQVLLQMDAIKQTHVSAPRHQGEVHLVAYLVAENSPLDVASMQEVLTNNLPSHMVPSAFMEIDHLPMTINGKVDTKALPAPEFVQQQSYVAPRTEIERTLCETWQTVLGIEKVGVEDNFFRLGGNSIIAIKLISACRKALDVEMPLALLFDHKTVAGMAKHLSHTKQILIPTVEHNYPPLSFAQERLLFIERFEHGSDAYHIPYLAKLDEGVSAQLIQDALNQVIDHHPVLKTVYRQHDGMDYQHILDESIEISQVMVTDEAGLYEAVQSNIATPFDLQHEASIRVTQYALPNSEAYLLILWHHIAFDGWSVERFMDDLSIAYQGFATNSSTVLSEQSIQYTDYAAWQRDYLSGRYLSELKGFWQDTLSGFETLNLPTDFTRPAQQDHRGQEFEFDLEPALSAKLRQLAEQQETTLFTLLLSGFYTTLALCADQADIVIGTPSDNRDHSQTQNMVGFFVNTLPLRAQVDRQMKLSDFVTHVHSVVTGAKVHQSLPFEKLVSLMNVERDPSRHPIFQVMFDMESFGGETQTTSMLPFTPSNLLAEKALFTPAKVDLSLSVFDNDTHLMASFNFAQSIFKPETIERMANIYTRVMQGFADDISQRVHHIDVLSESERHELLYTWNQTEAPASLEQTFVQLFEAQVAATPEQIALVVEDQQLTYQALNEKANQLAHHIRDKYQSHFGQILQPDTLIALFLERHVNMIVSLLAVQKAGAAYVPVSPDYPKARTQFILEDTQAAFVLTEDKFFEATSELLSEIDCPAQLMLVDHVPPTTETQNPELISQPADLAYVIYTSGTTGKPKGVMIEQGVFASFIQNVRTQFSSEHLSTLSLTHYTFDIFGVEYAAPLTSGGRMILSSLDRVDADLSAHRENINMLQQTPSMWQAFFAATQPCDLKHIEVLVGGESGSPSMFAQLHRNFKQVYHGYGPTEACVWSAFARFSPGREKVIGKALPGEQVYVLNQDLKPVPTGVTGELYIGGIGLARGYLNREELTQERFVQVRITDSLDTRLYKTGDKVRWLEDGTLEFLGRNDFQVKIRGHRIETGEIESALDQYDAISQPIVIAKQHEGQTFLAAYAVCEGQDPVDVDHLKSHLLSQLPEYMLPASFNFMDRMPMNASGKIDRQALPIPTFASTEAFVAPRNELEEKLCTIWQTVLGAERVGVHDNFFNLGGDSISTIKVTRLCQEAGLRLTSQMLFKYQTIAQLVAQLRPSNLMDISALSDTQVVEFVLDAQGFEPLHTINPSRENGVFMIPAGGWGMDTYQKLLAQLDNTHTIHVMENIKLFAGREMPLNILVDYYFEVIKRQQSQGPYTIGGYCEGAMVSLEVAKRLRAMGEIVEELFLIDPMTLNLDQHIMAQVRIDVVEGQFTDKEKEIIDLFFSLADYGHQMSQYDGKVTFFETDTVRKEGLPTEELAFLNDYIDIEKLYFDAFAMKHNGYAKRLTQAQYIKLDIEHDLIMDHDASLDIIAQIMAQHLRGEEQQREVV
ncbi:non-ribosomal peptide synthetase [Algicola sagamiensis]|uniref:non-ribosomal peptide synthetase n=1 Tax=Algicola sagamiensis TaxID=163869 RepID=UPI00036AC71D|nr:non-ribosomal peptide synthetase [Algicola sagamiensis]